MALVAATAAIGHDWIIPVNDTGAGLMRIKPRQRSDAICCQLLYGASVTRLPPSFSNTT